MGDAPQVDFSSLPLDRALKIARAERPLPVADEPVTSHDAYVAVRGGRILVRYYEPSAKRPRPVIFHLHGGGWVSGSVARDDLRCKRMCRVANAVVVSVDYRLSPEHRFPVAPEDALAAWEWLMENVEGIGGDPERIAISGASAGGHIAVVLMLMLRSRLKPLPSFQLLTYPALDPGLGSGSCELFKDGPFMTRARMAWYWDQYLGRDADRSDLLMAPLKAKLTSLPPALVQVAECDVLRDDGKVYVDRLQAAGVQARLRLHPGMIHGFLAVAPDHPESVIAVEEACSAMRSFWRSHEIGASIISAH
jgi:acetyl esterase